MPEDSGIPRALDDSLKRSVSPARYLDDGLLSIDRNRTEQKIRTFAACAENETTTIQSD
ncbi:IS66 family transposase [Alcaligenaceae bacterium CGII-47]|nr:IS66 family transposase [Alcaligenaceae bacterium CGII-47]